MFDVKINEYNTVHGYENYTVYRIKQFNQMEQPSASSKNNRHFEKTEDELRNSNNMLHPVLQTKITSST